MRSVGANTHVRAQHRQGPSGILSNSMSSISCRLPRRPQCRLLERPGQPSRKRRSGDPLQARASRGAPPTKPRRLVPRPWPHKRLSEAYAQPETQKAAGRPRGGVPAASSHGGQRESGKPQQTIGGPSRVPPLPVALFAPPRPEPAQRAPGAGGALVSHRVAPAVPSALAGLTSGFGMGPGVPRPPEPPAPGGRCGAGCLRRVAPTRRPGGRTALEEEAL